MSGEDLSKESEPTVKEFGERLIYTLEDLETKIKLAVQASPQRLIQALAYLESLNWGISGLGAMGQKIGFFLQEPPPPVEYPKMLYRGENYQIAQDPGQEQLMISAGFLPRVPEHLIMPAPPEPVAAPTVTIRIPIHESEPDTEPVDD